MPSAGAGEALGRSTWRVVITPLPSMNDSCARNRRRAKFSGEFHESCATDDPASSTTS
jgi:hypothetical protein